MISVVVYGRNDTHGYNHHRRVALSLNCLAEVLTDPADEIIFVDYNTPDELPTAVEALADTLTARCLGLLRILRVPAALHTERYGGRTHLGLVEPVARNAAARRSNPSNRWLLSTNTDMILVPLHGDSLSKVCGDLPDGFYALPRFELPEWVWERLPRADPGRALAEVERLGPALHLDEATLSDKWVRFDAPGDFQLVLREDFFAIDGFDEEMLLGWHLDSNLSRRMRLHRGSIETLQGDVAGYHCNHSRIPTVYHGGERISNDLDRFFYSVEGAPLPAQHATWGLADATLEEVPLQQQIGPAFVDALLATLPIASGPRPVSDAVKAGFGTSYDSSHVLPFIADSLVVSPLTTIGYLGINPILRDMLARLVEEMGLGCNMTVAELADPSQVDEFAHSTDLFVVDLGTDLSLVDESARIPVGLDLVFAALERVVEVERGRLELGAHPRRIVLVNSSTVFVDEYVLAEFEYSSTTVHCRVRRATVRSPMHDEASKSALLRARAFARWAFGRGTAGALHVEAGRTVRFADLDDYVSLSAGWAFPDEGGVWTWGSRSELSIAFPQLDEGDCELVLLVDAVCVAPDEALTVELLVDGVHVERCDFSRSDASFAWHVELPTSVLSAGTANLVISIDEPRSPLAAGWSNDERPLGLHLRSLTFGAIDYSVQVQQPVVFGEGTDGERLLAGGWSLPDAGGVWSDGSRSRMVLELGGDPLSESVLVLDVVPFLTPDHSELTVDVWALDTHLAHRVFRDDDVEGRLVLRVPPTIRDEKGRTVLDFHFDEPASPLDLGMSSDARRLGLHLNWLTLGEIDCSVESQQCVGFSEKMDGKRLLGGGWSMPDAAGVWSDGSRSRMVLELGGDPLGESVLVFDVVPFLTTEHPQLTVDVWALDTHLTHRVFRHDHVEGALVVHLPPSVRDEKGRTVLDFHFDEPARPVDLGISSDERRLGLRLNSLTLDGRLTVRCGETTDLTEPTNLGGFGDGWAFYHDEGIWTRGRRSNLALALEGSSDAEHRLVLSIGDVHPTFEDTRNLELLVNGAQASVRPLTPSDRVFSWRVDLPHDVVAERQATLTLVTSESIRVDAIRLERVDRSLAVGQSVSFIQGSNAERLLGDGWAALEATGVWSIGQKATIVFQLPADAGTDLELFLGSYAHLAPQHPEIEVVFTARNERLAATRFRHGVKSRVIPIPLTAAAVDADGRVVVDIEIANPVSPKALGSGSDTRLLGVHLKWFVVRRTGARWRWETVQHQLRRADPRRLTGKATTIIGKSIQRFRSVASSLSD